jgi:glutamate-1-semialdehyde aminotransferase
VDRKIAGFQDSAVRGSGAELWARAKKVIPGGNQLLSKRVERFLPGLWPAYYSKAEGCAVWDSLGNRYTDFAQMGVGSCVLGYADPDVNAAVIEAIRNGSMSSLNCTEEIQLAELLVALHPWAEMARFSRSGGEACAIAIRIARAATGRSKVAFCGYHGWHDWYLAANLADQTNLDGQLLPGLAPRGVPRELRQTAIPFGYNRLDELERIVAEHGSGLAAIILEPLRGTTPAAGFLEGVRRIADRAGAVLIFDEVTSGFRMNVGGVHLTLGVDPDIAVLGKALGNGFPISAIIGRRAVMDAAQESFISSTFWTERTGFVAALATLARMQKLNVPERLVHYGERLNAGWQRLSQQHGVPIHVSGIPPLTHLAFENDDRMLLQTLYSQEMLAKGYLLGAAVYTTYVYSDEIIDRFIAESTSAFALIGRALKDGNVASLLHGEPIQLGFKRLT